MVATNPDFSQPLAPTRVGLSERVVGDRIGCRSALLEGRSGRLGPAVGWIAFATGFRGAAGAQRGPPDPSRPS